MAGICCGSVIWQKVIGWTNYTGYGHGGVIFLEEKNQLIGQSYRVWLLYYLQFIVVVETGKEGAVYLRNVFETVFVDIDNYVGLYRDDCVPPPKKAKNKTAARGYQAAVLKEEMVESNLSQEGGKSFNNGECSSVASKDANVLLGVSHGLASFLGTEVAAYCVGRRAEEPSLDRASDIAVVIEIG